MRRITSLNESASARVIFESGDDINCSIVAKSPFSIKALEFSGTAAKESTADISAPIANIHKCRISLNNLNLQQIY